MSNKTRRRKQRKKLKAKRNAIHSLHTQFDISIIYLSNMEHTLNIILPKPILLTIKNYVKYVIFAAGKNGGSFGVGYKNGKFIGKERKNNKYAWQRLLQLETLTYFHNYIYRNRKKIFVKTIFNELYAVSEKSYKWTAMNIQKPYICSHGVGNLMHYFIMSDNNLFVTGFDYSGQIADGRNHSMEDVNRLNITYCMKQWLPSKTKIIDIQCGYTVSFFLSCDYKVYCCGASYTHMFEMAKKRHENDEFWGHSGVPELVLENIQMMAIGNYIFGFLDNNRHVQVYARSPVYNMNVLNNVNVTKIVAGHTHIMCLTERNVVYSVGNNEYGQIGNGTQLIPIDEYDNEKCFVKEAYCIKLNENIIDIECGGLHSMLLSERNNLYTFGNNLWTQCSRIKRAHKILLPYLCNKVNEFGGNCWIQRMIGCMYETILITVNYDMFNK
eukprot:7008_1